MPTFEEVPGDATVFRLVNRTPAHFPPGAEKPTRDAFVLTSADKEQGEARGRPPMLSVFDKARTTVEQGRAIRGIKGETVAFGLRVAAVASIAPPKGRSHLRVLRDELPDSAGPGADGHCGIEGLGRIAGAADDRNKVKQLQLELVDQCFRLEG